MGPPPGIVLLRHADAVARAGWHEEDEARPLSPKGGGQAIALATALAHPPPGRLLASPSLRCLDTLRPLAERTGLPLAIDPQLAEGSEPQGALARLLEVAGTTTGPVVACSHGDVVDGLLRRLAVDGAELRGPGGLPAAPATPKGGRWLLRLRDEAVVAGELVGPPAVPKQVRR